MDKRKLIAQNAHNTGYAKWEIAKIADTLLESIFEKLQQGEEVHLKGFGRFELKVRKARNAIHPQSKKPIHIPEKVCVTFVISTKFKPREGVLEKIRDKK